MLPVVLSTLETRAQGFLSAGSVGQTDVKTDGGTFTHSEGFSPGVLLKTFQKP